MKHIHMKKPDIKGFFQKIRNLKMQDIKVGMCLKLYHRDYIQAFPV